ncbi:MAG: polysaccharide biosynthesis protein [Holophagales bacterium]|nr:MAG: polysaccharide biosynthesis protein [Holophagales bacterium]
MSAEREGIPASARDARAQLEPTGEEALRRSWKSRLLTRWMQCALDGAALTAGFVFAYLLRFEFLIPPAQLREGLTHLPLAVGLQFASLVATGVYSYVWRYVSLGDLRAFGKAALASGGLLLALRFGLPSGLQAWRVPVSVIVLSTVLGYGAVVALRVARRLQWEWSERRRRVVPASAERTQVPVLLIGAGQAGMLAVRELQSRGESEIDVRGFIDDDPSKQGTVVHGVKILGTVRDLPRLVREMAIDHVIITIAETRSENLKRIVALCESIPVRVRAMPGLFEILQGTVTVSRFRDVNLEDLLGRPTVRLEGGAVDALLAGRCVLVTGAGGSIGSELARQVARFRPARLLLLERAENALFEIDREMRGVAPGLPIVPLLADIGDEGRMRRIFAEYRPRVVAHAAAHKHVPMVEANPCEAVKNNLFGTLGLAELAAEHEVETFVLISTDKAVRPTSVMGATKRMAELVVQEVARRRGGRFVAVRFGNVMGSAGSVIPIFQRQIQEGGPVTVTHPEMKRYFMTIPEAVQLVLQAAAMGRGGEIFVLDMGEPVRILELAERLITLSGFRPYEEIPIEVTGMRPGEKLFEEIELEGERMEKTHHPKIYVGRLQPMASAELAAALSELRLASGQNDTEAVRSLLQRSLTEAHLEVVG